MVFASLWSFPKLATVEQYDRSFTMQVYSIKRAFTERMRVFIIVVFSEHEAGTRIFAAGWGEDACSHNLKSLFAFLQTQTLMLSAFIHLDITVDCKVKTTEEISTSTIV